MEDALATVPRFLRIPVQMLVGNRLPDGMTRYLSHLTAHFFGVYDGHGGSQVSSSFCLHCYKLIGLNASLLILP